MLIRNGRPVRVLIVEDQSLVALDLGLTIEELGAVVVGQARSGEQAVELVRALSPDIVIMDVRLAGAIDGIDAAQVIAGLRGVALIFVTGNNDPATMARIRRVGNFIVVPKPVLASDLESALYAASAIDPPTRACAASVWQISALPRRARTAATRSPSQAIELAARIVAAAQAAHMEGRALKAALQAQIEMLNLIRTKIAARREAQALRRQAPIWRARVERRTYARPLGSEWM